MNPGEDPRRAALNEALDAAWEALGNVPLDDPRRGKIAQRVRAIEDALGAMEGE
ncbi:MAG TPA: hypothetical protein VN663_23075 [Ramlibacter sp.]|nr:hypothetical protein [Ramlibacter sp.]